MRKKYSMPESWVIELDAEDIVTTSPDIDEDLDQPWGEDPYEPIA